MPSNNADPIVHQVTEIADYEALREVANQRAGLLVARQRAATSDEEARAWRLEHRALRARLDDIQPHTRRSPRRSTSGATASPSCARTPRDLHPARRPRTPPEQLKAIFQQIIVPDCLLRSNPQPQQHLQVILLGGQPGAGKSTTAPQFHREFTRRGGLI